MGGRSDLGAFRAFVLFALVWYFLFRLPLGVWEGLRLVIVAPRTFLLPFCYVNSIKRTMPSNICKIDIDRRMMFV